MKFKEKMIANRMSVSFLLLIFLMVSCTSIAIFKGTVGFLIPTIVALILIIWLIYSSKAKEKLKASKVITTNHSDMLEDLEKVFKPDSQLKKVFAAYGLTIGIFILLCTVCVALSPELLAKIASSNSIILVFLIVFAISYILIIKTMK